MNFESVHYLKCKGVVDVDKMDSFAGARTLSSLFWALKIDNLKKCIRITLFHSTNTVTVLQ